MSYLQFIVLPSVLFLASALTAGFSGTEDSAIVFTKLSTPVGGAIILLYLEKLAMPPGNQTKPLSLAILIFLLQPKSK